MPSSYKAALQEAPATINANVNFIKEGDCIKKNKNKFGLFAFLSEKEEIKMKPIDHDVMKFRLTNLILVILIYFSLIVFANAEDQPEPPILQAGLQQNSNDQALVISPVSPAAVSALSTTPDSFVRFFRYPIEPPQGYLTMDEIEPAPTPTAYYRDVYVGAETTLSVSGPVASETWRVDWLLPNNRAIQTTIKFFSSYNGYQNCFIGDWVVCGVTAVRAYWYIPARCQPSGTYTTTFYDNGVQYDQRQFKLLSQIKEGKVPSYDQSIYTTQLMGWLPPRPTIRVKGCALTSLAMILSYHGITGPSGTLIKPDELNEKLKEVGGYTMHDQIEWWAVSAITGGKVNFAPEFSFNNLESNICEYGPQMVGAEGSTGYPNSHWMAATGLNENGNYLVNDPWQSRDKFYGENWPVSNSTRGFKGPGFIITNLSGISIYLHSPAELLLIDPQGRRLGMDPITGQNFKEIPKSFYELSALTDQETGLTEEPSKELTFAEPIDGEYVLEVTGTGIGDYALEVRAMNNTMQRSSTLVEQVPITPNERHQYKFYFSGTGTAPLEFIANFNGGGQNAKVNSLLSYNSPTASRTQLSSGTNSYTVSVFYSRNILTQSFHAELNGMDISSAFHPIPGSNERVTIPLVIGRNLLHLTVEGDVNGRIASDSDRLTFIVP